MSPDTASRRHALSVDELTLDHAAYAAVRRDARVRMIPVRAARRVQLGDLVGVEFENATTLLYQAQEMVYTERVADREAAAAELEVYERLLPDARSLCATFLVELDDPATVRSELERLRGLHAAVRLHVGEDVVAGEEVPGPDEDGPSEATASVHFLRFALPPAAREAFLAGTEPVRLAIEHPAYSASTEIGEGQRRLLAADLGQERTTNSSG